MVCDEHLDIRTFLIRLVVRTEVIIAENQMFAVFARCQILSNVMTKTLEKILEGLDVKRRIKTFFVVIMTIRLRVPEDLLKISGQRFGPD